MVNKFKGDIISLVEKSTILSDRLYKFKQTFPNFDYNIRLKITQENSTLTICTLTNNKK
jgi:hypothetical protein